MLKGTKYIYQYEHQYKWMDEKVFVKDSLTFSATTKYEAIRR